MRLGALIISARGGYQIPPPLSNRVNRQNHNLLITKLSDMGVPSWLLKVVMAFLTDRRMVVR